MVSIASEEWTKMKVEQLASTLASSAIPMALPVIERPGHPKPLIVPPAMRKAPSFGMTWNGNFAFSQYWKIRISRLISLYIFMKIICSLQIIPSFNWEICNLLITSYKQKQEKRIEQQKRKYLCHNRSYFFLHALSYFHSECLLLRGQKIIKLVVVWCCIIEGQYTNKTKSIFPLGRSKATQLSRRKSHKAESIIFGHISNDSSYK